MSPTITSRNQEYQQFAMANYKEVILDTHATLIAKKKPEEGKKEPEQK
jgi:hypothetical protein